MLNRLFRYNRFSSMLFLLSFFVSFVIMYYGLDLNRQLVRVSEVREKSTYKYGYRVMGEFAEDIVNSNDIGEGMLSGGNIVFRCDGPVGDGVINTDAIDIMWTQKEELLEPVKYEDYYVTAGDAISGPKCIIGDAWEDEIYVLNGIKYIRIFQIESCVIGQYVSNTFTGEDERCLVFRDGLSQTELDKLLFDTGGICAVYDSDLSDETKLFREWTQTFLGKESMYEEAIGTDAWDSTDGYTFSLFMSMYKKVYIGMLVLCFINCAFLAYFWGETHIYESMLKRVVGYGKGRLIVEVILQFALLEAISLMAVLVITCGYELVCKNFVVWCENICLGFMQIILVFAIFGVGLSVFPIRLAMKQKPAEILKNTD